MKYVIDESFLDAVLERPIQILQEEGIKKPEKDKIKLEDIKTYIDLYRGRRGRKNKILQVIDDIERLDVDPVVKNNVVKYAGVYLSQLKTNVDWTSEDIIAVILSDIELTKKYSASLGEGGEIKAKTLGEELAKEFLEREQDKATFMKELYDSMKGGTHKMIHQLPEAKYKELESSIIGLHKLNKRLLEIFYNSTKEKMFQLLLQDIDNILKKNPDDLTYTYINKVISSLLTIAVKVKQILKEDKPRGYEVKLSEIEAFEKNLQTVSGENYALWPETELAIKDISDLTKYFKEVTDYRKDAEKVIKNYSKRSKNIVPQKKKSPLEIWNETKIKALIYQYIDSKDMNVSKGTGAPHIKDIIELSEQILKENPTLGKYYKIQDEDSFYEVLGIIAKKITRYVPYEIRFGLEDK